ncbi:MAG: hypothetical protein ACP5OV_06245, partial [Acidimicrobiales bacterium]
VVITVQHDNELLFATGTTVLAQGDVVSALASPHSVDTLRQLLRGSPEPDHKRDEPHRSDGDARTSGTAEGPHAS